MKTKTKYSRRGIAALCGAAVLFIGETVSVNSYAEQTEMDLPSVQDEMASDSIPQVVLETQPMEMKTLAEMLTEATQEVQKPSAEEIPVSQETAGETIQTEGRLEEQPAKSETAAESETPQPETAVNSETSQPETFSENETVQSEAISESEKRQPETPAETEAKTPQDPKTVPEQTEPARIPETAGNESETVVGVPENVQTEASSEVTESENGLPEDRVQEDGETEFEFPEYDETETEIIAIDPFIYGIDAGQDIYEDSGSYGSYGGSTY